MSGLEVRHHLIWKCNHAESWTSPVFRLQNCEWHLQLRIEGSNLYLHMNRKSTPKENPIRPFQVTCFAAAEEAVAVTTTKYDAKWIWESPEPEVKRKIKDYVLRGILSFVVIFWTLDGSPLDISTRIDEDDSELSSLSSDLGKLLTSGDFSDVQLETEDGIRSVHRSVLAARSEILADNLRKKGKQPVDIRDVEGTVLDLFLEFLYTGKLPSNLREVEVVRLYAVGEKYAVHSLKKLCGNRLARSVNESNYQTLLVMSSEGLKEAVIKSIVENPEWLNSKEWCEFSMQHQALSIEVYRKLVDKTFFNKP